MQWHYDWYCYEVCSRSGVVGCGGASYPCASFLVKSTFVRDCCCYHVLLLWDHHLNERFAWGEACASFWWQPAPSVTKSLRKWHLAPKIEQKRGSEQRELCDILRVKLCQNVCVGNACASIPCASFIPSATSIMVSHETCHNTLSAHSPLLHGVPLLTVVPFMLVLVLVWKQQQDAKFQRAHLFPSTQRTLQPSLLRKIVYSDSRHDWGYVVVIVPHHLIDHLVLHPHHYHFVVHPSPVHS